MDFSVLKFRSAATFGTLLGLTVFAGTMRATNLLTATSPISVTCSTVTGPGTAQTITVKPSPALTGSGTIVVTFTAPSGGLVLTAPSVTTLSTANQATGLIYTVNVANGCVGASTGA